jgi:hypothetical protein
MSLNVEIDGTRLLAGRITPDQSGEKWALYPPAEAGSAEDRELCFIWNPLSLPASDCNPAEFCIAIFTHRNWPESQVLSLKEGLKSIGLIFSIQALTSTSVVLQSKKIWNDYGFIALSKLCTADTLCFVDSRKIVAGETYDISEFYDEDSVVVVIRKSDIGSPMFSEEEFKDYLVARLPAFVREGLFLQLDEGSARVRQGRELYGIEPDRQYIHLRPFSKEFPESTKLFVIDLLSRIDPYEEHPAFRFFLYYQVFESLLQEMYEEYYAAFGRLAIHPKFSRASSMKDLVDVLQDSLREKHRLEVLVNANRKSGDEFDPLRDGCEDILRALDDLKATVPSRVGSQEPASQSASDTSVPESPREGSLVPTASSPESGSPEGPVPQASHAKALYLARNLLFHSFSKVTRNSEELENLADRMAIVVYDLALDYKKPAISLPSL